MSYRVLASVVASGALTLALLSGGVASAGPARRPAKVLETPLVKTGRVQVSRGVGGRVAQLTDEQGKRWLLTGRLTRELTRLHGHGVRVWGSLGKQKLLMPTLVVARYELSAVGGRKPLVGRLRSSASAGLVLNQADRELKIVARKPFLKRLREHVGCKIWIVGDLADGKLKASKFGWLDCDKRRPIKPRRKEIAK